MAKTENPRAGSKAGDIEKVEVGGPTGSPNDSNLATRLQTAAKTRTLSPDATFDTVDSKAGVQPGQLLADRFTVIRLLGSGGTGEVFEADDAVLHEPVALKVVRARPGAEQELLRLRREVQLSRKVTHRNVCRMYDLIQHRNDDGSVLDLVCMELLPGETLRHYLHRRSWLPMGEALPIARQIARGLHAAHSLGIVHRDLKPANIMLVREKDGLRVAVTDFGLARRVDHGSSHESRLTQEGRIVGTPAYMAPEQVSGEPTSSATDIYSFGIMMYEMLSGQLPFDGVNPWQMAISRLTQDPLDLGSLMPGLDPQVIEVVRRCLRRQPSERFDSMLPILERLDRGDADWHPLGHKASDADSGSPELENLSDAMAEAVFLPPLHPPPGSEPVPEAEEEPSNGGASNGLLSGARRVPWRWTALAASLVVLATVGGVLLWQATSYSAPTPSEPAESQTWRDVERVLSELPTLSPAAAVQAPEITPSSVAEALTVARSYLSRSQPDAARDVLHRVFAKDAENPRLLAMLAEAHWLGDRQESAVDIIDNAWAVAQQSSELSDVERRRIRALHHGIRGDWRLAQQIFTSVWMATSDLEDGLWLVRSGLNYGTSDRMQSVFSALRSLPGAAGADPRIDVLESEVEYLNGTSERALQYAQRAVDGAGDDPGLLYAAWSSIIKIEKFRAPADALQEADRWSEVLEREEWPRIELSRLRGLNLVNAGLQSEALIELRKSLRGYRRLGSYRGVCETVLILTSVRTLDGDSRREALRSGLDACRLAGTERLEAHVLNDLARVYRDEGDFSKAAELFQESSAINEKLGNISGLIQGRISLSVLLFGMGRVDDSLETLAPAMRRLTEVRDEPGRLIMAQLLAAQFSIEAGSVADAAAWVEKAGLIKASGWRLGDVYYVRAQVAMESGDAQKLRSWARRLQEHATALSVEPWKQQAAAYLAAASILDGTAEASTWDLGTLAETPYGAFFGRWLLRQGDRRSAEEIRELFAVWAGDAGVFKGPSWHLLMLDAALAGTPDPLAGVEAEARRLGAHSVALEAAAVRAELAEDPDLRRRVVEEAESRGLGRIALEARGEL
ncbi:MAG: protein kinase [Acidobacteriota bacterium]